MKIRNYELDVNIQEELESFNWEQGEIKGNKLISCSPFRHERHPSFAVNLDSGVWSDSGNSEEYYSKGNFVKLLALLRDISYEEVEAYLIEKYATILRDTDALQLHLDLHGEKEKETYISKYAIKHLYSTHTDYFTNRGISIEVQQLFGLGVTIDGSIVAMPWVDVNGNIINIKYRQIKFKAFFFEKGGKAVHNHLYGLYYCRLRKAKRVYICESEIDALTLWSHGYYAVAVGGSSMSDKQKQLLKSSGVEELVIVTDNDVVGNRFRDKLVDDFGGIFKLLRWQFPEKVKDINDMTGEQIHESAKNLTPVQFLFLRQNILR
jgi:DNA primase